MKSPIACLSVLLSAVRRASSKLAGRHRSSPQSRGSALSARRLISSSEIEHLLVKLGTGARHLSLPDMLVQLVSVSAHGS